MTRPGDADVTVGDESISAVDSDEYDFAVAVSATLDGPAGPLRLKRRYEALPRHNDVLDRDAVDSNDELVDRPDAVHVHTRFYAGTDDDYLGDAHEVWRPDASALVDADAFLAACREHVRDSVADAYARVFPGDDEDE